MHVSRLTVSSCILVPAQHMYDPLMHCVRPGPHCIPACACVIASRIAPVSLQTTATSFGRAW
jgi:hypothetical protein